jgi:hypothetical protein
MSQPVKLSDALVLAARIAADAQERSIAGQVEFWAKLGQTMEPLLAGQQVMALRRTSAVRSLYDALTSVETPEGRKRIAEVLARQPFPHYRQAGEPGLLVRVDEDGTETVGRFVNRVFEAAPKTRQSSPRALWRTIRSEGNADARSRRGTSTRGARSGPKTLEKVDVA